MESNAAFKPFVHLFSLLYVLSNKSILALDMIRIIESIFWCNAVYTVSLRDNLNKQLFGAFINIHTSM